MTTVDRERGRPARLRAGDPRSREHPRGTAAEVFRVFLRLGLTSFGGPVAHIGYYRAELVERRKWLDEHAFGDIVALCQFLPGPNIGNASIVLGKRWFGLSGSIVAFLGLMALPFIWVLGLFIVYSDLSSNAALKAVVTGVGAAGAGLFIGTAVKLGRALVKKPAALALIAACFALVAVARVSLLMVVPIGLGIAVFAARRGWL